MRLHGVSKIRSHFKKNETFNEGELVVIASRYSTSASFIMLNESDLVTFISYDEQRPWLAVILTSHGLIKINANQLCSPEEFQQRREKQHNYNLYK